MKNRDMLKSSLFSRDQKMHFVELLLYLGEYYQYKELIDTAHVKYNLTSEFMQEKFIYLIPCTQDIKNGHRASDTEHISVVISRKYIAVIIIQFALLRTKT